MIPFEKREGLKRDFSYSECLMMIKMINISKNATFLTRSKIARLIDISPFDPRLTEIVKYLKKLKAIKNKQIIGSNQILEIDFGLLQDFIDEQDFITGLIDDYLGKYHTFKW